MLRNKRGRDSERPAHRDEEWPRLLQLEKALAQKRRLNTAKNKLINLKKNQRLNSLLSTLLTLVLLVFIILKSFDSSFYAIILGFWEYSQNIGRTSLT